MAINRLLGYKELLKGNVELKTRDELENIDWWARIQLESRYVKDKKEGFNVEQILLDKILSETDDKLILKMYEVLLKIKMEDEVIKDCMTKWEQNVGHNIEIDEFFCSVERCFS